MTKAIVLIFESSANTAQGGLGSLNLGQDSCWLQEISHDLLSFLGQSWPRCAKTHQGWIEKLFPGGGVILYRQIFDSGQDLASTLEMVLCYSG
jgi:hypothetical protein